MFRAFSYFTFRLDFWIGHSLQCIKCLSLRTGSAEKMSASADIFLILKFFLKFFEKKSHGQNVQHLCWTFCPCTECSFNSHKLSNVMSENTFNRSHTRNHTRLGPPCLASFSAMVVWDQPPRQLMQLLVCTTNDENHQTSAYSSSSQAHVTMIRTQFLEAE